MSAHLKIKLIKSTAVVSICTLLSRGLGFLREILMANFFGTTLAKSAFDIAFLIPNLFRRVLGEGAFSAAFVPVYTEAVKTKGRAEANKMAGSVLTLLGCTLFVLVAAGIAIISLVLLNPSLDERVLAPLPLLIIMLPYAFFVCMVAACIAVLNSQGRFAVPALSPVLLNIVWIITLIFICPKFGENPSERIYGVAWGVLAAGGIQLILQFVALLKSGFKINVSFDWRNPEVRKILALMGPAAIGMGVFQINFLVDRLLAMCVASWAPATLTFSERLIYFPLGIFATALGTVLLPTFSRQAAGDKGNEFLSTLVNSLKSIVLVMIPASVGIFVLARPLVQLVFEHGVFTEESTTLTVRALWFYSPGLLVFSLHKVFVPAFYAMKDTITPVKVGVNVVVINLVLNVIFIVTWPEGYKHAGLAFATVLASAVNSFTLAALLTRKIRSPEWGAVTRTAVMALLCSAVMGIVVYYSQQYIQETVSVCPYLASLAEKLPVTLETLALLVSIMGAIGCGFVVYLPLSFLICRDDFRNMFKSLRA